MISEQTVFRFLPDVRYRTLAGEGVIVRQTAAEVLVVNELGARILEQLDGDRPVSAIIEAVAADYDVARPLLARDIAEFLEELAQSRVIAASGS